MKKLLEKFASNNFRKNIFVILITVVLCVSTVFVVKHISNLQEPPVNQNQQSDTNNGVITDDSNNENDDISNNDVVINDLKDDNKNDISNNISSTENDNVDNNKPSVKPEQKFTVKFITNGGGKMDKQKVTKGTKVLDLDTPNREGYIFLGWYYDKALTKAVESNDTIIKDTTLYASYLEQTSLETLQNTHFTAKQNVGKDFTIKVISKDDKLTANDIKSAIIAKNHTNPAITDFIKVTPVKDAFLISGIKYSQITGTTEGFEEGTTYSIKLNNDNLMFDDCDETVREFNFTTSKKEVLNFKLNNDIVYVAAKDLKNITNEGKNVNSLDIALYTVNTNGTMKTTDLTNGTFEYTKENLKVGQVVSVYEGLIPNKRTLQTPDNLLGDIAYVEITAKKDNTYSYKNADVEDIIFTPDVLPIPEDADKDKNKNTITVDDQILDFSKDIYAQMNLDSQTTIDIGDFIAFYTGDISVISGENAAKRTEVFGEITKVEKNNDSTTTITYKKVTWDEIDSSMDVYTQDEMSADELLEGINIKDVEKEIEQQAINSGFVEEAGQYLASLALATDNFTKLSDNMNLQDYKVELSDGTPVTPEQLSLMDKSITVEKGDTTVTATIGKKPKHLGEVAGTNADKEGIVINLEVTSVIEIDAEEGVLEITVTGKFVEEIGFAFGASSDTEWSVWGIIPYISEWTVAANVDLIDYTGFEIEALMVTKESEEDEDEDDIFSTGQKIADEIKEMLKNNTNPETGDDYHNKLIEKYSNVVQAESDWITLVSINLFENGNRLPPALPIIHLEYTGDFVIQMDASVAVGFEFEYLEGKRYIFNVRISEGKISSSEVSLQEKKYELCFYAMGRVALKAGLEFEFKVGLLDTSIANVGFSTGAGPYTKLYGYFFYELKYTASDGRKQSYSGALLTQVGTYFHLTLQAEAIGGRFSAEYDLLDMEWLLWEAGRRDNVLDFENTQEEMPEVTMRQYVRRVQLPDDVFNMVYLDLINGEGKNAIYNDWNDPERYYDFRNGENYHITFTNDKFSYDPKTNEILVTPDDDDIKVQGEMIITWKKQPMSFSSKPLQRRVTLYWDNLRDGYMIVPYTNGGSYIPMIIKGYEEKVTSPKDPVKLGYTFAGWYTDTNFTNKYVFPKVMPNKDTNIYAKWKANTDTPYTVEHYIENFQSGAYEIYETEVLKGTTDSYVQPSTKTYEGYITPEEQVVKVQADGSTILRYYYKLNRSTVTFESGMDGIQDSVYELKYGASIVAPQMSIKGYTFAGWTIDGTTAVEPEKTMGVTPLKYTAMWEKNADTPYRVEYYVQQIDGSYRLQYTHNAMDYVETELTEEYLRQILIDNIPADDKFIDGNGITPSNMSVKGVVCEDGKTKVTGDGKLVVKINYSRTISYLTFDPDNQVDEQIEKAYYYEQLVDAIEDPTRIGYTFAGWDDMSTEAVEAVTPITSMIDKPITYKALWTPNNYSVHFNKGNDEVSGEMSDQIFVYDDEKHALSANAFVRKYYDFVGWSTQEGGSIAYEDKEKVGNLTDKLNGIVNLYALWKPTNYTITYKNVEKATHTNIENYNTESETIILIDATRTGYTFAGWYDNEQFSGNAITEIKKGSGGNKTLYAKWIANTDIPYKVEHYKQQLDGSYILADIDEYEGTADSYVEPAVKLYEGFSSSSVKNVKVEADGSTVVKYNYTRNSYQITLNVNGGTLENGASNTITALYEEPIQLPKAPVREGYGFNGWFDGNEKFEAAMMPAKNVTLTAKWVAGQYGYVVNHYVQNVNGGTNLTSDYTLKVTDNATADMDEMITPDLKEFEGFSAPSKKTIKMTTGENIVNYYYTRNKYKISWDLNGSTANGYTEGEVYYEAVITKPTPIKQGYSYYFDDTASAQVEKVEPVTTMPAKDMAYKVIWTPNDYIISFEANGGTVVANTLDPITVTFDTAYGKLPFVKKDGYTFDGWYTASNGGEKVEADTILKTDENHCLYAHFTPVTYTITYIDDLNGTHSNQTSYSILTNGITLEDAKKTGYTFTGWYDDNNLVKVISAGSFGDRELTARWKEHTYNVVFHANNGSGETTEQTFTYTENKALNAKADSYIKDGFVFKGWATSANGEKVYDDKQIVEQLTSIDNGTINLYAVWEEVTYQINYIFIDATQSAESINRYLSDVVNGSLDGMNPETYSFSDNYKPIYAPTKPGYKFEGWYIDPALEKELDFLQPGVLTFANYHEQTLYAKMTPIEYTVAFYQGTQNESPETHAILYGEELSLDYYSANIKNNKAGYTLLGWATQKDSTEVQFTTDQVISNLTTEDGSVVKLYAVWQLNVYSITYNMGVHTNETSENYPMSYSIETLEDINLPNPEPKSNFAFGGWYTDAEYTMPISKIAVKEAKTNYELYAKWEHAGEFSISYIGKSGDNAQYLITRKIPDGAKASAAVQTVYVRTLNGTAYATTPEVATGTGQDKYHFTHNQAAIAFDSSKEEAIFNVKEKDDRLNDFFVASYQIGSKQRNYYVDIYKVVSSQNTLAGTIGTGRVTRKMAESSYELTTNFYRWFSDTIVGSSAVTVKSSSFESNTYYTVKPDSIYGGSSDERLYKSLTSDKYSYKVSFDIREVNDGYQLFRLSTVDTKGTVSVRAEYKFDTKSSEVASDWGRNVKFPNIGTGSQGDINFTGGKCYVDEKSSFYTYNDNDVKYAAIGQDNKVRMAFDAAGQNSDDWQYRNLVIDVKVHDKTKPAAKYVSPLALTDYSKGDEVMLTVIYSEPINSISGNKKLTLSSRLSKYFENPTYVDNGTGTNAIVFKVKAKDNISADTVQNIINQYLAFPESNYKNDGFETNIGTLSITVKDILGN